MPGTTKGESPPVHPVALLGAQPGRWRALEGPEHTNRTSKMLLTLNQFNAILTSNVIRLTYNIQHFISRRSKKHAK